MKLAIISHTEHYRNTDGTIVGWGPTVNEINHLLEIFDEIYHLAMFQDTEAPLSALPYISDRIRFIQIPTVGGKTVFKKLAIIYKAPQILKIVSHTLKKVDCFQLRTPTGIGVFLIPYLTLFVKKKGWFKYAGNWNQKNPPFGYAIQRWMLKKQYRNVTINGTWKHQPKHCITFENPCLTLDDLKLGEQIAQNKSIEGKLSFCFVGRLEKEKGVERIIEAFKSLKDKEKSRVDKVHFVGNGTDFEYFKSLSNNCNVSFIFHGSLSRLNVFEIYKQSQVFLLPTTASEGFPKVITESLNFGCIPIVSNISSIGQYIENNVNGFLINTVTSEHVKKVIKSIFNLSNTDYIKLKRNNKVIIEKFTFSYYNNRIQIEILN